MSPARVVIRTVLRRIWSLGEHDSDEMRYAAAVSIWARWVFIVACIVEANYRVEYGEISHIVITTYFIGLMVPNAYVQWRIRSLGKVEPIWLIVLSAIDAATLTGAMSNSGGFDSRYFAMYYFALALFAWVFTSPYLVFAWITIVAAAYVFVCLPGRRWHRLRTAGREGTVLQTAGDVWSSGVGQPDHEIRACSQA